MDGDLPEDNSSSVKASSSSEIMGSSPLLRTIGCSARSPSRTSFQGHNFPLPRPTTNHSHIPNVQRKLVTLASVSPAPPASSPSLDVNGGTNLQVFDASDSSTL